METMFLEGTQDTYVQMLEALAKEIREGRVRVVDARAEIDGEDSTFVMHMEGNPIPPSVHKAVDDLVEDYDGPEFFSPGDVRAPR